MTGVEDDGRRRWLRLLVGAIGWLVLIVAVVYLAANPTLEALDVAVFLVTAVTVVTIISVLAGLQLRGDLMRERMVAVEEMAVDPSHDTLGRPLELPESSMSGEIVLDTVDGRRRYFQNSR
jgi:hypothetical protein